jgi:hypothetical protein
LIQPINRARLAPPPTPFPPQIQILDSAKSDPRVVGLLALLGGRERFAGVAQVQELRSAIIDFRVRRAVNFSRGESARREP